jgi:DNA-binding MarR family transcriptional regulator
VVEATGLPASTTTSVVDRLVQRDLVSRTAHPSDRRRVLVSATGNGCALQDEMDCHDLNTLHWLSRDVATADLERILIAFKRFQQQIENATVDDFNRLRSGRNTGSP